MSTAAATLAATVQRHGDAPRALSRSIHRSADKIPAASAGAAWRCGRSSRRWM